MTQQLQASYSPRLRRELAIRVGLLLTSFGVGLSYCALSMPGAVDSVGDGLGFSWVRAFSVPGKAVSESIPALAVVLPLVVIAILVYCIALMSISSRLRDSRYFLYGVTALVLATSSLHIIVWLVVGVAFVLSLFLSLLGFLAGVAVTVLTSWYFWISVILLIVTIGGFAVISVGKLKEAASTALGVALGLIIVGVPVAALIALFAWLVSLLPESPDSPGLTIPGLGYVISVVVVLLFVTLAGNILLDQFKSATKAGDGLLGVVAGALGVGSSLAVLLLAGNIFGSYSLYPGPFAEIAARYFLQSPSVDATITLVLIVMSIRSLAKNVLLPRPELLLREFRRSLVIGVVGLVVAIVGSAISARSD